MLTVSFTKRKIGQCFMELGEYEKAIESYHDSLRIREASVGSEREKSSSYGYTTSRPLFRRYYLAFNIHTSETNDLARIINVRHCCR